MLAVDRAAPALTAPLLEQASPFRERGGKRVEHHVEERLVIAVRQCHRIVAGQEPGEHAIVAALVPAAFVIHTAAAERVGHEEGTLHLVAPEGLLEENADPQ